MTQKTNLNVSPYYDDFDRSKDFYKVLYKPGYPVQARELTTAQSIIQNQIQKFGTYVFKDGSKVIPGDPSFEDNILALKVNPSNLGVDVSVYIDNFLGKKVTGQESKISGEIKFIAKPSTDPVDDIILYITAFNFGNEEVSKFIDGESLVCSENVIYGNTTINANTPFVSLISSDSTSFGSIASIEKGVYFIRGYFVDVLQQTIILDYFTNKPSYRIGLQINETIVDAKDDSSLYDNASGFTNFAAPGADRLKITLTLTKKELTDKSDTDFLEVLQVENGKIKKIDETSVLNELGKVLAERTFEESGNYSVKPFIVSVHNSLNNNLGNNGLYFEGDTTQSGNTPSDDLMSVKISPGLSYVRGFRVNKQGTNILDVEKPRDVGIKSDASIDFNMGNVLKVNNVRGIPKQGSVVKLFNNFNGTGDLIGSARVYSFNLEDSAYSGTTTRWDLRLFDIQTFSTLSLNTKINNLNIPEGSFIKGKNSNASGFIRPYHQTGNIGIVTLGQTSGTFAPGEELTVDGIDLSRTVGVVTASNVQNIKSASQPTSAGYPNIGGDGFRADSFLETFRIPNGINVVDISNRSGGVSTITAGGDSFLGLRKGSVVRYNRLSSSIEIFNKVKEVASDGLSVIIEPLNSVTGIFDGSLPNNNVQVSLFAGAPNIRGSGNLYVPLNNLNVESVDLSNSRLTVTKQITGKSVTGNQLSVNATDSGIVNTTFESFDQERYSIHNDDGTIQGISEQIFSLGGDGSSLTINGLTNDAVIFNATLKKNEIKSKIKTFNKSQSYNVRLTKNSPFGGISNGLTPDKRFGLRVQDDEISLNYPDVSAVIAIYESLDDNDPVVDTISFSDTVDVNNNAIIGENIIGGNAVARIISKPASNQLGIVYLTSDRFSAEDEVTFDESDIKTKVNTIVNAGKFKDLTFSYNLDKGQREDYYDYSRIIRKKGVPEPTRRLLIVFDYYSVPVDDTGDVFTVFSYDKERYTNDIPNIDSSGIRASDTIDFRPRVPVYNTSTNAKSPFDFGSRNFDSSITQFITPNESTLLGYNYYLPRTDCLYLSERGEFVYDKGVSSIDPKPPVRNDRLMKLATITLPPYLYVPQNAMIIITENKRYRMKDIGFLEDRVSNLEEVTSLSLLETNVQSLQILDSEGRNRFKSGFFVDPFRNYDRRNKLLSSSEIDTKSNELIPERSRNTLKLVPLPKVATTSATTDQSIDYDLFDTNVRKTGNLITLDYEEVGWIDQVFATSTENVNPFLIPTYRGEISLNPRMDMWTRLIQLDDNHVTQTGLPINRTINMNTNVSAELQGSMTNFNDTTETKRLRPGQGAQLGVANGDVITTKLGDITGENTITGNLSLLGNASGSTTFNNADVTIRNQRESSDTDDFMRSRNTEFSVSNFPSGKRFYVFLDGQAIDFIPKLVEITPNINGETNGSQGTFIIGEQVNVYDSTNNNQTPTMIFRACQPDHKEGEFNNPTQTYQFDPYAESGIALPQNYSQTSTVINVDTRSLSEEAQGSYYGYLGKNFRLEGQESNAVAFVKDVKLISDNFGDLQGSFFIRNPYTNPRPPIRISTGTKTLKITSSPSNSGFTPGVDPDVYAAEIPYTASGTVERWQNDVITTVSSVNLNINNSFEADIDTEISVIHQDRVTVVAEYYDPLAQTFVVGSGSDVEITANNTSEDQNGAFITAVEVFFKTIDEEREITLQLRETTQGARPSRTVLASKTLAPTNVLNGVVTPNILTSDDASVGTKFIFSEPVYLPAGKSYAIVLLAPSSKKYIVHTGVHGETAVNAQSIPGASGGSALQYSKQYANGALFKSQNGALWTEDNEQDLTFKLYKAKFVQSGSLFLTNPDLDFSNGYVPNLSPNPIETFPKTGTIGITTINSGSPLVGILTEGRKICGRNSATTATITGVGQSVGTNPNCLILTNGGTNYVTDTFVETFAITGKGSGLKLNISATDGVIDSGTVITGAVAGGIGQGYRIGDKIGIVTSTVGGSAGVATGTGAEFTVGFGNQLKIDTIYLTDVQGDQNTFSVGSAVSFFNDSGDIVSLAATTIVTSVFNETGKNSGKVFKVKALDHGMHSSTNKLSISDVASDVTPTELTTDLLSSELTNISVANTTNFVSFEGFPVGSANTGYVKINNEIIGYNAVDVGVLKIASGSNGRGVDNTNIIPKHDIGSLVSKYELNGVSLRRIVRDDLSVSSIEGDLDSYFVEIDRTKNGASRSIDPLSFTGAPQLSFNSNAAGGGLEVKSTENIAFDSLVPIFDTLTPVGVQENGEVNKTNIEASIRTVSGTSVGGSEISFADKGYEPIQLNTYNSLNGTRLVASKLNENAYLTSLPRNKSFTLLMNFSSNNENLSPAIDMSQPFEVEFISHRINNPIGFENYSSSNLVKSINDDPHSATYVTNLITLNKPATSLKVFLTGYRPPSSDFRVLYSLLKKDSDNISQSFELFPGYKNLVGVDPDDGFGDLVVDSVKNDGRPDSFVPTSANNEYREYQFTADNLDEFIGYAVKIVMFSSNQSEYPKLKELRTIAVR